MPKIKVVGAAMQNDGTALQPGILFDEGLKCNVGLKAMVDLQFIKENPSSNVAFLKQNVITEANVSIQHTVTPLVCQWQWNTRQRRGRLERIC